MDRRSLLAIVLTILVLLVWQVVFISPKRRQMERKRAEQIREKQREDSIAVLEERSPEEDTLEVIPGPEEYREERTYTEVSGELFKFPSVQLA